MAKAAVGFERLMLLPAQACWSLHRCASRARPGLAARHADQPTSLTRPPQRSVDPTGALPEMAKLELSAKGKKLIELYGQMAAAGYDRVNGSRVEVAFSDFELRYYRNVIKEVFDQYGIASVLDYGAGGADWDLPGFHGEAQTARQFFNLNAVFRYEPARDIDERQVADSVVCFDVLEHVYVADIKPVVRDLFQNTGKLLIINVACYDAAALLPNGENAHITVRPPLWWKGLIDSVSIDFPKVAVFLMCSVGWRDTAAFKIWKPQDWEDSPLFVVNSIDD